MDGRYTVLPKGAHDLNMNNLLSNLDLPDEQYPGVFCLPPVSEMESSRSSEIFNFRILFVCTAEGTGDNQVKYKDAITGAAQPNQGKDWNDMHDVAMNFMHAIETLQRKFLNELRLSQSDTWRIVRFANMQNDNLNGVLLMFSMVLMNACEFTDIAVSDVSINFPDYSINLH